MNRLRVLLAEDHPLFRKGLRSLLRSMDGVEIVGEATTGREAIAMARTHRPDVVLMDLQMPDGGGLAATRAIAAQQPQIRILVVTLFEDEASVLAALQAGARGYLLKDAGEEEMKDAIRAIGRGDAIFSPSIASHILDTFAGAHAIQAEEAFPELTEREHEVLGLIASGQTNSDIAAQLGISLKTVQNHVSNIYGKLQVANRAQAAIRAREAGLGKE